jgi:hypothetical protein
MAVVPVIVPMSLVASEPSSMSDAAFEMVPCLLLQDPSVPSLSKPMVSVSLPALIVPWLVKFSGTIASEALVMLASMVP